MVRVDLSTRRRWTAVLPVIQSLESRLCLSAVVPGASENVGGVTIALTSADQSGSAPCLVVTGTDAADVIKVGLDPADSNEVQFQLNGATVEFSRADVGFDAQLGPQFVLDIEAGGGNDLIENDLPGGIFQSVILNGGDGNDTVLGSTSASSPVQGADGITRSFGTIEQILGGDGDDLLVGRGGATYISGGAGDDSIFADSSTQVASGDGGNDVIHGATNSSAPNGAVWVANTDSSATGSSLLRLGNTFTSLFGPSTPGSDDRILPAGGGAGNLAGAGPATLVGDVLVIHGTAGSDSVDLWADGGGVHVAVNGLEQTFKTSSVKKFAFDAAGGADTLTIHDGDGVPTGWVVRTANAADSVNVEHVAAAGPSNLPSYQPPAPPAIVTPTPPPSSTVSRTTTSAAPGESTTPPVQPPKTTTVAPPVAKIAKAKKKIPAPKPPKVKVPKPAKPAKSAKVTKKKAVKATKG